MINASTNPAAPSRAFKLVAVLALVAALPGVAYALVSVTDTLKYSSARVMLTNVLAWLAIGMLGPLCVIASVARMLRRPDHPVALLIASLVLTAVPTVLLAGLLAFGRDTGWAVLACMAAGLSGVAAAVIAIAATIRSRLQRR